MLPLPIYMNTLSRSCSSPGDPSRQPARDGAVVSLQIQEKKSLQERRSFNLNLEYRNLEQRNSEYQNKEHRNPENQNCELRHQENRSHQQGFRSMSDFGNPEQGRLNPEHGQLITDQGRLTSDQGRFNPEQGRFNPEQGRLNPESDRMTLLR